MELNLILTGATGMVGEGVLLESLENPDVAKVLVVGRRSCGVKHPKMEELIVPDFFQIDQHLDALKGYDGCLFCAGISSVGMGEEKYTRITYDTTLAFAKSVLAANPQLTFCYISGSHTDSTEKGRIMWARVKGRTENALLAMPFRAVYNFRPGAMSPYPGQKNSKAIYTAIVWLIRQFSSKSIISMQELGRAMIRAVGSGAGKEILEIADIKALAKV